MNAWLIAVLAGLVQGFLEWLPVSSEGAIALLLTLVGTATPDDAVRYALFLHAGTAISAATYYRAELRRVLATAPAFRPGSPFDAETADLSFLSLATAVSVAVGLGAYATLVELASELAGGAFVALVGGLLVVTGLVQRVAKRGLVRRSEPTLGDAVLVGGLQGLAVLPGVSRSGTTVSALLLRGHEGVDALRLSFLLSIPAALGAGVLAILDGGAAGISPTAGLLALAVSAAVGYLAVGALVSLAERVAFWGICVGFGGLAVLGGLALWL